MKWSAFAPAILISDRRGSTCLWTIRLAGAVQHSCCPNARSATAGTSRRRTLVPRPRNRGRMCPKDDSGEGAPASSNRPPIAHGGRSPRRHSPSRSAGADNQSRPSLRSCSDRPAPGRAREGEGPGALEPLLKSASVEDGALAFGLHEPFAVIRAHLVPFCDTACEI